MMNITNLQCFRHSELQNGRPSTAQFREKLPWFLNALPSADCAKGGNGAYTSNVELNGKYSLSTFILNPIALSLSDINENISISLGYENGIIQASAFRTYHTPLNKQADYVNSMRAARDFSAKMSHALGVTSFVYLICPSHLNFGLTFIYSFAD